MTENTELLGDLRERMVRIETKLDTYKDTQASHTKRLDSQDDRIAKLETNHKVLAAIGAVALAIATFFQTQITGLFG
jgi:hypothetical protein